MSEVIAGYVMMIRFFHGRRHFGFYQSVDFDFSGEVDTHTSNGSEDIFVTKIGDEVVIPALSGWGLISMAILVATTGVYLTMRCPRPPL